MCINSAFSKIDPNLDDHLFKTLKTSEIDINDHNQVNLRMEQVSLLIQEYISSRRGEIHRTSSSKFDENDEKSFFRTYNEFWGDGINFSFLFLQLLEEFCQGVKITADKEHIREYVLARIMGRAMRIYLEVITLLKNGFPYGAASLTRSLYELMIIIHFIKKHEDDVALAYYEASDKPLDEQDYDDYGWARLSGHFSNGERISLKKLRVNCDMVDPKYDSMYSFHCKFAHAAPQTVNYDIGSTSNDIYTGPTLYAVDIAGGNAALFLRAIFIDFIDYTTTDGIYSLKALFCVEFTNFLCAEFSNAEIGRAHV